MEAETTLFDYRCKEFSRVDDLENLLSPYIKFIKTSTIPFMHTYDQQAHPRSELNTYLKVPLSLSAPLLSKGYFPISGYCYVTERDFPIIISDIFRSGLQLALNIAQKIEIRDERILRIFKIIKDPEYTGDQGYKVSSQNRGIDLNNIDAISKLHFPPCMKKLYNNLKSAHHLKYMGRLQFGLFLKGLGFPLEESLQF